MFNINTLRNEIVIKSLRYKLSDIIQSNRYNRISGMVKPQLNNLFQEFQTLWVNNRQTYDHHVNTLTNIIKYLNSP